MPWCSRSKRGVGVPLDPTRTSLDIEDDVRTVAEEVAHQQGLSADQVVSKLLRSTPLAYQTTGNAVAGRLVDAGLRPFVVPDQTLVTNKRMNQLRDLEGI